MTKLDYLLRECVRTALSEQDGVMSVLFYNMVCSVWHHVTYENPESANVPEVHPVMLMIKQYALGYSRNADLGNKKHHEKALNQPVYPSGFDVNKAIEEYKKQKK